jgi:hypothetical protein
MKSLRQSSSLRRSVMAGLLILNAAFLTSTPVQSQTAPRASAANAPDCGKFGQPACSVSRAVLAGRKPAGCAAGSFFDPIDGGTCWSCPADFVRHVTHVKAGDACIRPPGVAHARATRHGKGRGLLGIDCLKGQFPDPNGFCFSCPQGYTRTASAVTAGDACVRPMGAAIARASFKKSLACAPGSFFDLVDGGTCWRCPSGYGRTLAHVKAPNACAVDLVAGAHKALGRCADGLVNVGGVCARKGECGALGQRPCQLTERLPSCNKGLAEDFLKHRCVEDQVARAACTVLVDAIWTGKEVIGLLNQMPALHEVREAMYKPLGLDVDGKLDEIRQKALGEVTRPLEQRFTELKRIAQWMNNPANLDKLKQIFSPQAVCSSTPARLDEALRRHGLVPLEFIQPAKPRVSWLGIRDAHAHWLGSEDPNHRHFYMGYQLALQGAKWGGATLGISGVTDFRGNGGMYIFAGPQVVTNVGGGLDARVLFFTSANMGTFEGYDWSPGGSVDVKKLANVGVELIFEGIVFDRLFAGQTSELTVLRGFGIGGGVGMGVNKGDVGVSITHSWRLN